MVVDELNQWDKIDPDKIYLIFTNDERMIKHLERRIRRRTPDGPHGKTLYL